MEVNDIAECDDVPGTLVERHSKQLYYTFMGSKCLIALGHDNTSKDSASKAWAQSAKEINIPSSPHVFSMSSYAYLQMIKSEKDQSILLLGESGSGKSISRKLLTKNLCDLGRPENAIKKTKTHSRILKVDSIITAFGHAANLGNTNATCFIPYYEFQFNSSGEIVGMKLIDYLLDRSRVTGAEDGGRTFHIFHDMFEDLTAQDKTELGLTDPAHFTYTSGSLRVLGPADRGGILAEITDDMNSLGIGKRETAAIFSLLSTILHLGNIFFMDNVKIGEAADIKNYQKLDMVANLLGVTSDALKNVLTYKMKNIGRDFVVEHLDMNGSCNQRDALARSLYAGLFSWIIEKINQKLCRPESEWVYFVSILDIPGITGHSAPKNGLQRLLINYANERLLNNTFEKLDSGWKEKISNQGIYQNALGPVYSRQVLDLLQSPRYGILNIIDAETASAGTNLCQKIIDHNEDSSVYLDQTHTQQNVFGIKHYVGVIEYNCSKFVESNSDNLQGDFVTLIRGSPEQPGTSNAFLRSIFSDRLISTTTSSRDSSVVVAAKTTERFPSMKRKKALTADTEESASTSIVYQFMSNYEELLAAIYQTNFWVIFHINRGSALHSSRVENASIVRQCSYNNFDVLKKHPALKYVNGITIDTLSKKYGKTPKDLEKNEKLSGRTMVFLTQKSWLQLENGPGPKLEAPKSSDSLMGAIDDGGSDQDSDTASHYGSEFEAPQRPQLKENHPPTYDTSTTKQNKNIHVNQPEPKREPTRLRKNWLAFVWSVTCCFFPFCLRLCGMRDTGRQIAWREKVALCLIIFLMNASLLFLIIGTGWLICPASAQLSPGQVSSYNNFDNTALVYMYGSYYAAFGAILSKTHQDLNNNRDFWKSQVFGTDVSLLFPKDLRTYCPEIRSAISFTIFGERVAGDDESQYVHRYDVKGIIDNLPRKGTIVWDKNTLKEKMEKDNYRFLIINNNVYDVTGFYFGPYSFSKANFFGREVQEIFDMALLNYNPASSINSIDVSNEFDRLRRTRNTTEVYNRAIGCMGRLMYVGKVDRRNDLECKIADYILLAASIILVSVIGFKFLAALQCYNTSLPEESDKFAICQVPCYTEGNNSLKAAINSLATMKYDDKRKLIFLICDGMIIGAGNEQPTPQIVLDILGVDPNVNPEPLAYKSLGEGNAQLNYAKVFSGLYESNGHTVPYIVVVKVGKPSERQKPGNRGKRDSQLILLQFLSRVHHNQPMCPLELELYHQMKNVVGVDPSFYEFILMVDADTQVSRDALSRLISHMNRDKKVAGTCGETRISNERASFTSMIQIYEYFISHHLAKSFESLFSTVTCLPGCFSMYRIKSTTKNKPVLISPALIKDYAENQVDTLHLRNLLHLGEDRYLTTLILKHFPNMKTTFTPDALCQTNAPDKWGILLSQRRRWINSTVHNLLELMYLQELCGFCCFSMRFVVFIDLLATLVQPASMVYIVYLIVYYVVGNNVGLTTQIPLISLILIGAVYGLQVVIFIFRKEWQHIGWMVFYIIASPLFAFYIPLYSFWHFDDFSWGNTRVILGDNGKKVEHTATIEPFDPNSVPLKPWSEQEVVRNSSLDWELASVASATPIDSVRGRPKSDMIANMPNSSVVGGAPFNQSMSPERPDMRKRIQDNNESSQGKHMPSDDELIREIRHILSTTDLMTITKKKVRQQLSDFYGVNLSSKKQFIHATIDSILKGEL